MGWFPADVIAGLVLNHLFDFVFSVPLVNGPLLSPLPLICSSAHRRMRREKGKSGQTDGEQETQERKLSTEGNKSEFILITASKDFSGH